MKQWYECMFFLCFFYGQLRAQNIISSIVHHFHIFSDTMLWRLVFPALVCHAALCVGIAVDHHHGVQSDICDNGRVSTMLSGHDMAIFRPNFPYRTQYPVQWRHDEHGGVSNHPRLECLLTRLFRRGSKKISKLRVTGLCEGNSLETGEFPAQRVSNAENVSIWVV